MYVMKKSEIAILPSTHDRDRTVVLKVELQHAAWLDVSESHFISSYDPSEEGWR